METHETGVEDDTRPRRTRTIRETAASTLWLTAVAPVALSLLSLALSVYTIFESNREPEVWLSAPDVVRLAAAERAWFYVQPRLVSAARNDRVAVISGLRLEVTGPDGGPPASFLWDEQGTWEYDPVNRGLTWIYQADAAPLVVGPSSPQLPTGLFEGPPDWRWQAGTYEVTIVAARGQDADALQTTFAVTLPAETVKLVTTQPRTLVEVRVNNLGG